MTLTNHSFGQQQHAAYEASIAHKVSAPTMSSTHRASWVVGKIVTLAEQVRKSMTGQPSKQLVAQS